MNTLEMLASMQPPAAPFRGVLPFRLIDRPIFTGRRQECETLYQLIRVFRGVMLYGDSGSGKSSLVNAGVIPMLIEAGFEVEKLRVQPLKGAELVIERLPLSEEGDSVALPSVFTEDAKSQTDKRRTASVEVLHSALKNSHPPEKSGPSCRLVIFDQFEEIVTLFEDAQNTKEDFNRAKELQQTIVDAISGLLLTKDLNIKLLLVFRDDYLGRVAELFSTLPQLKDQSLRLVSPPLASLPAIIIGPFQVPGLAFRRAIDPAAAAHLVRGFTAHTSNGLINLTEVQIACDSVWEDPKENDKFLREKDPLTAVQSIFDNYVARTTDATIAEKLHPIAYNALNRLVTPSSANGTGTRNIVSEVNLLESLEHDGYSKPDIEATLKALCRDARLIFLQTRGNIPFYEIVSEFLVKGITTKLPGVQKARANHEAALLQSIVDAKTAELKSKNQKLKFGTTILGASVALVIVLAVRGHYSNEMLRLQASELTSQAHMLTLQTKELTWRNDKLNAQISLTLKANEEAERARSEEKAREIQNTALLQIKNQELKDQLGQLLGFLKSKTTDATFTAGLEQAIEKLDKPLITRLAGPAQPVHGAVYSPDGRFIALGSGDKKLRIYPRLGGKTLAEGIASVSAGGVNALAFSPDGTFLLTGSAGSSLRLFDPRLSDLGQGRELPVALNTVNHIGFSPDGKSSVATDDDGEVVLLDWSNYPGQIPSKPSARLKHDRRVSFANFSADGTRLVTSSDDGIIRVFATDYDYKLLDVQLKGKRQNPLYIDPGSPPPGQRTPVRRMRFSPTNPDLIVGGAGNSKLIWYYLNGNRLAKFQDNLHSEAERGPFIHEGAVLDTAFSPDGARLASIGTDGLCLIWETDTAKTIASLPTALHGRLLSVGWQIIQGKSLLALGGEDGRLELWDLSGPAMPPKPAFEAQAHAGPLVGISFDPLNEQLLTWDGIPDAYTPGLKSDTKAEASWKAWEAGPKRAEAAAIALNQPALWSLPNALRQSSSQ